MSRLKLALASAVTAIALAGPAAAQSFDCADASKPDEKAICANRTLANLDVKNATLYDVMNSLVGMGVRGDQQDAERAFLKKREACGGDTGCIRAAYEARIGEIEGVLQGIYQNGPY